jgi:predicted negative regulator of RcsB-dependent stress response
VDRISRKQLKTDPFRTEVQHTLEYVTEHKSQAVRYGSIALVVVVLIGGWYFYSQHEHTVRQEKMAEVFRISNANVGPAQNAFELSYATPDAKDAALVKALSDLSLQFHGTEEGTAGEYMLAAHAADKGNAAEAERRLRDVVDNGKGPYTSMARVQLARIYGSQEKIADAKNLLQPLIDKPTMFVSKEQAELALAKIIGPTEPDQARKILMSLRTSDRPVISQAAMNQLRELPQK